jgi:hypothetical protein
MCAVLSSSDIILFQPLFTCIMSCLGGRQIARKDRVSLTRTEHMEDGISKN